MKSLLALAPLSLSLLLFACSTTSTTEVTAYDASGNVISTSTTSSTTNQAVENMAIAGNAVKEGAVAGYEWTKDKTVKGYEWVKDKVADDKAAQPAAEAQ